MKSHHTSALIFKAVKLIVAHQLRQEMLNKIHESHLGIVECNERAKGILYRPNSVPTRAGTAILVSRYSHSLPERPWEKVGTDLCHYKESEFLLCVDYFSKFPEITTLRDTTSCSVIIAVKSMFERHGIPDVVISDNGPLYAGAEFKDFAKSWEFRHIMSSLMVKKKEQYRL